MNNLENIEYSDINLESEKLLIDRIGSISKKLAEEYIKLKEPKKHIARQELIEYIDRIDSWSEPLIVEKKEVGLEEKFKEQVNIDLEDGIEEIISSANQGRRDRKDLGKKEQKAKLTKNEKNDFKKNIKTEKKDKKEAKKLIKEIQEKYKKLLAEEEVK